MQSKKVLRKDLYTFGGCFRRRMADKMGAYLCIERITDISCKLHEYE